MKGLKCQPPLSILHPGVFSGTSGCEWNGWNKLKIAVVIHSLEDDQFTICKKKTVLRIVLSHTTTSWPGSVLGDTG
ncbi:uncharacterized protein BDCG_17366 [Blastomyces dermatitidis ER-3]|uniref:Uncharacterized protein n=1 Tax=Ajellomyces dermatitidis (strain ER-3 / ATCC MYA-2586) TaxID=559297 RepID=A0ABX2VYB7_AJEDR|nr:uncharacterized protein BDCG_17366 [Blastomyces dermatitidis ER-3]OAT02071.1 hypothetical protein BDCG_17366 [Blastomyces dermatitidis ER-3]